MMKIPLRYYKYIRLVLNLLSWFAMGAMHEILSPTLPDLSIRVNADYEVIGRTVGLRVIGNFFTPILSGLIYDRFPRTREVAFGLIFIISGALEIAVPYCRSVWLLSFILILQGISEGALVTAAQSMIIELFGAQASSALQFMHLGWGVGSFLAAQIVRPFLATNLTLSKKKIRYACLDDLPQNITSNVTANATITTNEGSRIEYAFFIIGSYAIIMGVILFIFSFVPKPIRPDDKDSNANSKKSIKEMLAPAVISDGKPLFGSVMIVGLFLIYLTDVGLYVTYTRFVVTIGIDPCKDFKMTQSNATLLLSIMAAVFSCSRIGTGLLFSLLIAKNKSPGIIIISCTTGMTVSTIFLSIVGLKDEVAFWILSCSLAFFHAPMFGGGTPWFNQHIRVTSSVIAVAVTGGNVGKFFLAWFGGYVLKAMGSLEFLLSLIAVVIVLEVVVVICFAASLRVGRRPTYKAPQTEEKAVREKLRKDSDSDNVADARV